MPRLGWTMETGTLAEWIKHDGDVVAEGDVLFAVETDKVAQEVEAVDAGILRIPPDSAPIGTAVPVGAVLAYLVQAGEAAPFEQGAAAPPPLAAVTASVVSAPLPSANTMPRAETGVADAAPTISPRARRVAGELGLDWTMLAGTGRTGRIVERDVRAAATQPDTPRPRVTPVARRVAQQAGVDVEQVASQLPGKRITRADIEAATSAVPDTDGLVQPITQIRRVISERMAHSAHTAAPVTLTTDVDATELVQLRQRIKRDLPEGNAPPSYTDLLIRLVALALLDHPQLNSSFSGDTIVRHQAVHVGVAVDSDQGLLVPVVRDAHLKSIQRIAAESAQLIARARNGKSRSDDLHGGTFTISNLGMYEIDAFTPIINLPEAAVLGVGRIVARQVVIDEDSEIVAIRKMMALSLTFDHRLVDGAPAARFLQQVKRWIERPYGWATL
jgi:pyruvate dehydrogenase E2 component (dihydrolipoamide acetyltransferase)